MTKPVYIWFTEPSFYRFHRKIPGESMEDVAFVSETIEEGEREFAKRYSDFSAEEDAEEAYTYTDDHGDHYYCWAIKRELINNKEENT